ncbi:hypothetical protein R6Q59_019349 [Mikania micrantha]
MIEETATSLYDCTEEIPVMEVSISLRSDRRSRDADVTNFGIGKRRRFGCDDEEDVFQLQYCSRRDDEVKFHENVSDHQVNSSVNFTHDDLISDLKAECVSGTDIFMSINDGFSRETSTSSISEEMESSSTSTVKKTKTPEIETTSRRKPPPATEKMPSAAELEEFFSKAEKYEEKRFAEKYNFDIVNDIPMEGRYQWIPLPLPLKP